MFKHKFKSIISGLVAAALIAAGPVLVSAKSNNSINSDKKVTICHRTNSVTNAYVRNTVSTSAVDGQGNNDHSHHTGPVATSQSVAQDLKDSKKNWGDIIPPVSGVTAGLNWSSAGQAIYNNNCKFVTTNGGGNNEEGNNGGQVLGGNTSAGSSVTPQGGVNAGAGGASAFSLSSL